MTKDRYSINKIILKFSDSNLEEKYTRLISDKTIWFCRISWLIIVVLGSFFLILDEQEFGPKSSIVSPFRFALIIFSFIIFILTFINQVKKYLYYSSALFITVLGSFCLLLMAMSSTTTFTPYFASIFVAYAGIFTTTGVGFRFSVIAMIFNLIFFEILIIILFPVTIRLLIVYNFFLPSFLAIFMYAAYLVEKISRDNFVVSQKLQDSLNEIKTLSGLLPICSKCKMIRDDKGYWNQIEKYFQDHGEVSFTHSLCPHCVKELYPDFISSK